MLNTLRDQLEFSASYMPMTTGVRDLIFKNRQTKRTLKFLLDCKRGNAPLAPIVNYMRQGKVVDRSGFETFEVEGVYQKVKRVTTPLDLQNRLPGQDIYPPPTPQAQAEEILRRDTTELDDMITRREEHMCSQLLQTGGYQAKGEAVEIDIKFKPEADQISSLSGNALFSDKVNSDPLGVLRAQARKVFRSGYAPSVSILGIDAYDALMKTDQFSGATAGKPSLFSNVNMEIGRIKPEDIGPGMLYLGRINEIGQDIFVYSGQYTDDEGNRQYFINPKNLVTVAPDAGFAVYYGAIQNVNCLVSLPRFFSMWTENDPSVQYLMLESAPLAAPLNLDSYACVKVLA